MNNTKQPTVETFYDFKEGNGELRSSNAFFERKYTPRKDQSYFFDYRKDSEKTCFCGYCGKPLKIKGGGEKDKRKLHFSHLSGDGKDCPYHIGTKHLPHKILDKIRYHGQRVGPKHEEIKHFITSALNGMPNVTAEEEKVMRSEIEDFEKAWKRPDITAHFSRNAIDNDHPITVVFEIQLSTTYFSVIASREQFYHDKQVFIIWVFDDSFSPIEKKQKFAQMDVLASNNHNAYVLDEEAKKKTIETGKLHFTCYYNYYQIVKRKVGFKEMKKNLISLEQLTFDEENYKAFYVDVEKQREECVCQLNQLLEDEKTLQPLKREKSYEDKEELLYRQTKQEYETIIQEGDSIKLKKRIENAPKWELNILVEVFRSCLCYGKNNDNETYLFRWLIDNSYNCGIDANDVIRDFEDFDSLLNKDYPFYFIQNVIHWLFSSFDSWVWYYCENNKEQIGISWKKIVENNEEDKMKRGYYAIWIMYLRVALSHNMELLQKLNNKWYLFMGFISIYCHSVLHNNQTNIKSSLFDMINIHPDYAHLLKKFIEKKPHDYASMKNKKNKYALDVLEETIKTKEQVHDMDDLALCIFPKIFL